MTRGNYGLLAVAVATLAAFWIVPEFPLAHLDDPSHWGVLGYAATVVVILARVAGRISTARERRWMLWFLAGMPLVYVADWIRFGGTSAWLFVELVGLVLFGAMAWWSRRRSPWLLPAGIGAHAAWDGAHYNRTEFVPDWYIVGCIVVDVAVAVYLALHLAALRRPTAPDSIADAV